MDISLDTYVSMKVFHLFRDKLAPVVNHYRKDEHKNVPIYKSLFLSPENFSKKRSFVLKGVLSPYVCLWPASAMKWNQKFYGRSVLPRDFKWETVDPKDATRVIQHYQPGFIQDFEKRFELTASSYYRDFIGHVNQDLLDFDRLRYFRINVDELGAPGFSCVVELLLEDLITSEQLDEESGSRAFNLGAKYKLSITLPILSKVSYLEGIRLYLNSNVIYSAVFDGAEPVKEKSSAGVANG